MAFHKDTAEAWAAKLDNIAALKASLTHLEGQLLELQSRQGNWDPMLTDHISQSISRTKRLAEAFIKP